jgi:hypothetical protein
MIFSSACDMFDLSINTKKTEVMFQYAVNATFKDPRIKIKGSELLSVDSFTYLGTKTANINSKFSRISKASSAFGRLLDSVWGKK